MPCGKRHCKRLLPSAARSRRASRGGTGRAARCAAPPQRIVSLNVCTDQLLLDLVPRERIAALSYLAVDPDVSHEGRGGAGPQGRARHGRGGAGAASPISSSRRNIRRPADRRSAAAARLPRGAGAAGDRLRGHAPTRSASMAEAVGDKARGEAMIAAFDKRMAAARPEGPAAAARARLSGQQSRLGDRQPRRRRAWKPRVSTTWRATFRSGPERRLPLESSSPTRPISSCSPTRPTSSAPPSATICAIPRSPRVVASRPHMQLPMPLWLCATPQIADAVEELGAEAPRAARRAARPQGRAMTRRSCKRAARDGIVARHAGHGRARGLAGLAFVASLLVGPAGIGLPRRRRRRAPDLVRDPPAARHPRRAGRRRARAFGRGAAGLPAQSAGRAGAARHLRRRRARRGHRHPFRRGRRRSRSRCRSAGSSARPSRHWP